MAGACIAATCDRTREELGPSADVERVIVCCQTEIAEGTPGLGETQVDHLARSARPQRALLVAVGTEASAWPALTT